MAMLLRTPDVDDLREALSVMREWQCDGSPLQLHPGDVGWFWRFGADATAAAVRTWSRDGQLMALGLLDGADLLRLALVPTAHRDEDLARHVVEDVVDPERGVLPPGPVSVEAPTGTLVHDLLGDRGWNLDEPWTLLRRDLTHPVEDPGVQVSVVGPEAAGAWSAVQASAFDTAAATADRWHAMAGGPPFADARCLLAHDEQGNAVAGVTVWSAGHGRPGIIEPMGVHRDHRGHGHGTAATVAAAAALRDMGASSAMVATPSTNVGAVATYASAGFEVLPERHDRRRAG